VAGGEIPAVYLAVLLTGVYLIWEEVGIGGGNSTMRLSFNKILDK
jgi:hypothetical protein